MTKVDEGVEKVEEPVVARKEAGVIDNVVDKAAGGVEEPIVEPSVDVGVGSGRGYN